MKKREVEELFKQNEKMLHMLAHRCSKRCGRPEEEVYGQACYEFIMAVESFEKNKGAAIGTWIYKIVNQNLAHWGKKMDLPKDPALCPELSDKYDHGPRRALENKEWLAGLGEEAREVIRIILDGPAEVMGIAEGKLLKPKNVMGALRRYLRKEKGWSWPLIWRTFKEVKLIVNEL